MAKQVRAATTVGFLSNADYAREHGLRVEGGNIPDPFQTFESVGFPNDIMDEVRLHGMAFFAMRAWHG